MTIKCLCDITTVDVDWGWKKGEREREKNKWEMMHVTVEDEEC